MCDDPFEREKKKTKQPLPWELVSGLVRGV